MVPLEAQAKRGVAVLGRKGLARIGILTFIDAEANAVRAQFGLTHQVHGTGYFTTPEERLDVVTLMPADISNLGVTNATTRFLEDYRPEVLAVAAIGGRIRGVDLGDVVVADYLHWTEYAKYSPEAGEYLKYLAIDQPSSRFREAYSDPVRLLKEWPKHLDLEAVPRPGDGLPDAKSGPIIAGEKLLSDPSHPQQQKALDDFPDALAVDMESAGVARAVHEYRFAVDYNPSLCVIRGISDDAHPPVAQSDGSGQDPMDNQEQRELWRPYASCVAAAFLREVAIKFLAEHDPRAEERAEDRQRRGVV